MSCININGRYVDYNDISYIEDDARTVSVCLKRYTAPEDRVVSLTGDDARRFLSWFENAWKDRVRGWAARLDRKQN